MRTFALWFTLSSAFAFSSQFTQVECGGMLATLGIPFTLTNHRESNFAKEIREDPKDLHRRMIYADWLEEQGNPRDQILRLNLEIANTKNDSKRRALEQSRDTLLNDWLFDMRQKKLSYLETAMLLFPNVDLKPLTFTRIEFPKESGTQFETSRGEVTLSQPFEIASATVTQVQWVLGNGSRTAQRTNPTEELTRVLEKPIYANLPMTSVSWRRINRFLKELTRQDSFYRYRLPSNIEWEVVASADLTWPIDRADIHRYAWFGGNSGGHAHAIGLKKRGRFGLYDMLGNVRETTRNLFSHPVYENKGASFHDHISVFHPSYYNNHFPNFQTGFRLLRYPKNGGFPSFD